MKMNEDRTPKQISGDFVLCNDNTLWKWINGDLMVLSGWRKLPNIPSDDEYGYGSIYRRNLLQREMNYGRKVF